MLRERVAPARSRDIGNTVLSKTFPGGILVLTGANSAVGLRSMPARYLFLDEVDAYPPSADEEGDPVALGRGPDPDLRLAAQGVPGLDADDQGHVADRAGVRGLRPAAVLRRLPALRSCPVPDLRAAALGQGQARDRGLSLRGLRRADRGAAQDGDARRGRVAGDGHLGRSAHRRLPHLQPLLARSAGCRGSGSRGSGWRRRAPTRRSGASRTASSARPGWRAARRRIGSGSMIGVSSGSPARCRRAGCSSPPAPTCRRTGSRSMSGPGAAAWRAGWSSTW